MQGVTTGTEKRAATEPRRNNVGLWSLLAAVGGAVACRVAILTGVADSLPWLDIVAAGFEAATVGALADWFAVTALFRHPLGLPIPHTAIIPARRAKITEGIVSMIEDEWLSPEVIGARLARFAPSGLVIDWLRDPEHVARLGGPLRDMLRSVARLLDEAEVAEFVERTLHRQLRDLPIDAELGRWLQRAVASDGAGAAFETLARSLVKLARQPRTAKELQRWLDRTARALREDGKLLVPLFLRRKVVQRKLVEAVCDYASIELAKAAQDPDHPVRLLVLGAAGRAAARLAAGEPEMLAHAERLRAVLLESLEAGPLVRDLLARLRRQLEEDLGQPDGYLAGLIDRQLRSGVLDLLAEPARRAAFDQWVRATADDLLRRHHHQIGLTVRENLEALDTAALVAQIEDRVGADLQFIRLNGAVVGGLIGVLLALVHRLLN